MLKTHRDSGADATVAVIPFPPEQTSAFGILKMDATGRIVHFDEKPPADRLPALLSELPGGEPRATWRRWASTSSSATSLEQSLASPRLVDFGRHVIPDAVPRQRVQAHVYRGYWEDVGTIQSYFQANLALCEPIPPFDFYDEDLPSTRTRAFLPAVQDRALQRPQRAHLRGVLMHGADIDRAHRHPQPHRRAVPRSATACSSAPTSTRRWTRCRRPCPRHPAGRHRASSVIENAIIDKNARIGRGVRISDATGIRSDDDGAYFIREGIVIVPKNGVIPDGTVI